MDIDKETKTRSSSNFKKPKSQDKSIKTKVENEKNKVKNMHNNMREERVNQKLQQRKDKINDYFNKKRGLTDSDTDTLIAKSINISNLSMLADKNLYIVPPKICVLIALNSQVDLELISKSLQATLMNNSTTMQPTKIHTVSQNMWTTLVPTNLYKGKERLSFFTSDRHSQIYNIIDTCKAADIIVFVSSCKNNNDPNYFNKIKLEPESCDAIDSFGHNILSILREQGMPPHIGLISDIDTVPEKHKTPIKKLFTRYFESELQAEKIITLLNEDDYKSVIRHLCGVSMVDCQLQLKKHRSYMLGEKIEYHQDRNELDVYGYIRGNTLNGNNKIHISGFGDYDITKIEFETDPCENKYYLPDKSSTNNNSNKSHDKSNSMNMEVDKHSKVLFEKDKNIILPEDLIEPIPTNNLENKPTVVMATGNTAVNINNKENDENFLKDLNKIDKMINLDIKEDEDDVDLDDISFEEHNYENDNIDAECMKTSKKHIANTNIQFRSKEDMEFKDEVDTPIDMNARDRFKKYRGLESLKAGSWNIGEDLPEEYKHIYTFENFKQTWKNIIKKTHENGFKISGNYIKIVIKNFGKENLEYMVPGVPLILSTLLEHERKLTIANYKIKVSYDYKQKIESNELFETQVGFRRWLMRPKFSLEVSVNSDKLKYEKHLEEDKYYIASAYAQLTYPNTPVLFFKPINGMLSLAIHGKVLEPDFKQVMLKKIILTGYPVKIKKKRVVARYMFFNPEDINYFKPVQLHTKHGLRGHISESLGTHGYMKCVFNNSLKQNDTICMNLYKRVFPKWFVETWKYKVYYGNRLDYAKVYDRYDIKKVDEENFKENEEQKDMILD